MGLFNTLPHRKNSHVKTISALLNKKDFLGPGTTRVHLPFQQASQCSTQLSCNLSGLMKSALYGQRLPQIQNVKKKPVEWRAQTKAASSSRRHFYVWTGHSISERKTQKNHSGKQAFKLIQLFAKLISMPGLREVQKCLWAQLWQVSAGDQRNILLLKLFGAHLSRHEDQGHADLHPGNRQNHIKHQAPTTHMCYTGLVLGWLTRGIPQLFHTATL